jgi:hypothetical protein
VKSHDAVYLCLCACVAMSVTRARRKVTLGRSRASLLLRALIINFLTITSSSWAMRAFVGHIERFRFSRNDALKMESTGHKPTINTFGTPLPNVVRSYPKYIFTATKT